MFPTKRTVPEDDRKQTGEGRIVRSRTAPDGSTPVRNKDLPNFGLE
jgi:hypothetical protein